MSGGSEARGSKRLLWDSETIGRSLDTERPSPTQRLESEIGEELTQLLLTALRQEPPKHQRGSLGRTAA